MKNDKDMSGNEEDLKKSATNLFKIKKDNAFQIPEEYFENLPLKIQERLTEQKASFLTEVKQWILRPGVAVAGLVIVVLAVVGINYLNQQESGSVEKNQIAIKQNEKANQGNIKDITKDLKAEDIKSEDIEQIDESLIIEQVNEDFAEDQEEVLQSLAFNSEEEIDYLLDSNIDVSLITEELKIN